MKLTRYEYHIPNPFCLIPTIYIHKLDYPLGSFDICISWLFLEIRMNFERK